MTLIAAATHTAASRWSLRRACPHGDCAAGFWYVSAQAFVVDVDPGNVATNSSVGSRRGHDEAERGIPARRDLTTAKQMGIDR